MLPRKPLMLCVSVKMKVGWIVAVGRAPAANAKHVNVRKDSPSSGFQIQ